MNEHQKGKDNDEEVVIPMAKANEIVLIIKHEEGEEVADKQQQQQQHSKKLLVPTIRWKVKSGTTVRIGEIIAEYTTTALVDHDHNKYDQDDGATKDTNNANAGVNKSIHDSNEPGETSIPPATTATATSSNNEKTIKRPRKRNRNMMMKNITSNSKDGGHVPILKPISARSSNSSNTSPMQVEDILKSFGKNRSCIDNDSTDSKNVSIKTSSTTSATKPRHEDSIHNETIQKKKVNWIPIQATMNGFIEIYPSVKQCKQPLQHKQKQQVETFKMVHVLGQIEPCSHPAVIDGLCVICGQYVDKQTNVRIHEPQSIPSSSSSTYATTTFSSLSSSPSSTTIPSKTETSAKQYNKNTLAGGVTISISQDYAQSLSKTSSQMLRSAKKLNLVLDLDHTLLHATADRRATQQWRKQQQDQEQQQEEIFRNDLHVVLLPMMEGHPMQNMLQRKNNTNDDWQPHYVKLRPHLAEFISAVRDLFEITIYTAGTRTYANKIADVISRHVLDYQSFQKKLETKKYENEENEDNDDNDNNDQSDNVHSCGDDDDDDDIYCLDEGELNDLRQKVARLEERIHWDKSRKERQEYIKRMNEQFENQRKEDEVLNDRNQEQDMNDKDTLHDSIDGKKNDNGESSGNGDDDKRQENPASKSKRRKVTFTEEVIEKVEAKTLESNTQNNSSKQGDENGNKTIYLEQTSSTNDDLKTLKAKLKKAEKREEVAQQLRKKIFGTRIITRTDLPDLGRDVKSLKRVFPCGGLMAVIVDDREDVWANADNNVTGRNGEPPHNLLLVKPYHFAPFLNFADVNNSSGKDLSLEKGSKKKDEGPSTDEQLLWTADILQRLHSRFYDSTKSEEERKEFNVPSILMKMRKEVFSQSKPPVKVLLSGLVPLHLQSVDPSDERVPRHEVIRYCQDLGAEVMTSISNSITHVIANKDGTDKILQARQVPGCAVVRIGWLMECYWSIKRRDTELHYLGQPPIPGGENGKSPKNILLLESDSDEEDEEDDDEDDDLLLEFKKRMNELQSKSN